MTARHLTQRLTESAGYWILPGVMLVGLALMSGSTWVTLTVAGLAMGVIVFMAAAGMSLVFGLMDIMNFAHGALVTFGAFVAASVFAGLRAWGKAEDVWLNLAMVGVALASASIVAAAVGWFCERVIIRPVYRAHLKQILVTIGALIVAEQIVPVLWGAVPVSVPRPETLKGAFLIGDIAIEKYRVLCIAVGLVIYVGMYLALSRTRIGLVIRAGVINREMVQALGYRIDTLFVAGSALAGFGGVMWAGYNELITATVGNQMMVLVFIVIIIGGLGSVPGTMLGALLVGLTSNYVGYLVPKLALGSTLLLMVLVLLWKPKGLLPVSGN
ncbi:MAG TPA: branched-chain amino acid ABC transporter permease [bacterium]